LFSLFNMTSFVAVVDRYRHPRRGQEAPAQPKRSRRERQLRRGTASWIAAVEKMRAPPGLPARARGDASSSQQEFSQILMSRYKHGNLAWQDFIC